MALIHIEHATFNYTTAGGAALPVLRDIQLDIERGEYLAVLGRNGSGKSTLARLLNGLLVPTSGRVIVDGIDTADAASIREVRRRVGLVFQSPDNQIISNTVEEDVAFGPENLGVPHPELRERVEEALAAVGMWEYRERPPHALSAGQKQRVAIAGILAMRPSCLVLDEATAMLDPAGRRDVLRIARDLHRTGTTVIAITHHMTESLDAARIAILHEGKIGVEGTPQQVFSDACHIRSLGLDLPPAASVADKLRRSVPAFPTGSLTPEELANSVSRYLETRP